MNTNILQVRNLPGDGVRETNRGQKYEGWSFNSGNYLFTTDTK